MMAYNTGATFVPGGEDAYYMPEVVAPAPQRLAELPLSIEQNVAHMEYQAASGMQSRMSANSIQTVASASSTNYGTWSPVALMNGQQANQTYGTHENFLQAYSNTPQTQYTQPPIPDQPNFSPFPKVSNRGPNVPPTDDEREIILESAREAVLASDDFELQLTWAQDALTYVEVSIQNEQRISQTQPARSRTPRVEHMLREDAMKVVDFLAGQYHPRADFIKGMWLEFGKFGHRVDKREAFNCYKRSSERGYARSYYRIGMQFENSNDALTAIKYYQQGVDKGDAASCYRLGMMTLLGQHGQVKDFQRGLHLIRLASDGADENAPQGAYVLGMLQAGELAQVSMPDSFLPRDIASAKRSVERSAFLGFAKAQVRMGSAYELADLGCSFDAALSLHYNSLAARQGEADAEMSLSKWFLCGQEGIFPKNEEMAFVYAQRAAVGGLGTAQFAMGYFYEVGIYVVMDLKQAREWYQKADESGNTDASKRIKEISRSKTISRKDHESVALQRIRQQHAAMNESPSIPSIQEEPGPLVHSATIDMPDPSRLNLNSTPGIPRPTSTAPYPVDLPGQSSQGMGVFRPNSAFGINPNLRTGSAMSSPGPGPRLDPQRLGSLPNINQRPYPNTMQASTVAGYGRGGRPLVAGPNYNYVNQPPPRTDSASAYQSMQGYPSQRPSSRLDQKPQPTPTPTLPDIGYSAPLEEPKKRRPLPSQQQQQRPPPKDPGHQPTTSEPGRNQAAQPKPSRQDDKPQTKPLPSKPLPAQTPTPKPAQQKPVAVSASAASSRPGKGPKTFEEMGVPQAKKESDCIVM